MWYRFEAYNTTALYGRTRNEDVMWAMLDHLNGYRPDVDQYLTVMLGDSDDTRDGRGIRLANHADLILTDDTTVERIEELNKLRSGWRYRQ